MSDKVQKIKEEIERLKHNTPNAYDLSRFMLLEEIESFINSLPEKPVSEDLEEEFYRFIDEEEGIPKMCNTRECIAWGVDIAHHFAEWQKEKDIQDFLEKAEEFFYDRFNIHPHDCYVIQYDSDTPLESMDDFIKQIENYINDKL